MGDRGKGGLEDAMKKLNLSAAEKKGIKVGRQIQRVKEGDEWHAVGKAMSEKQISVEGIMQTLGKIWCGDRGLICKEMGKNLFLFRFNHPMGMKRALEDGPWFASHSLLVMAAYDGNKTIEAMEFNYIPIWVRVSGLPMGMMNASVAEIIGGEVGEFLDVDVEENGTAVGRFLRIKLKLDVRHPIRTGVTLETDDDDGKAMWCPFEYEFLPDFCYKCGIIGHIDKGCRNVVVEGDRQYGSWLRVMPPKRRFSDDIKYTRLGGGRVQESRNDRSNGDWRREKEERLLLGSRNLKGVENADADKEKGKKMTTDVVVEPATLLKNGTVPSSVKDGEGGKENSHANVVNKVGKVLDEPSMHGTIDEPAAVLEPHGGRTEENEQVNKKKVGTYKKIQRERSVNANQGEMVVGKKKKLQSGGVHGD